MKPNQTRINCQISNFEFMSEGSAEVPRASMTRRLKLMIRRHLSPKTERRFKTYTNNLVNWLYQISGRSTRLAAPAAATTAVRLQAGDWVRVRSTIEINATLNHWRQLKGCTFMSEMAQYCDTNQRVAKRLERFVDERDLRVKKVQGVVLLEGVQCQGTADFGRCDRFCYLFWREEWLEKIAPGNNVEDRMEVRK